MTLLLMKSVDLAVQDVKSIELTEGYVLFLGRVSGLLEAKMAVVE